MGEAEIIVSRKNLRRGGSWGFLSSSFSPPLRHTEVLIAISFFTMVLKYQSKYQTSSYIYWLLQQLVFFDLCILERKKRLGKAIKIVRDGIRDFREKGAGMRDQDLFPDSD